MPRSQTPLSLEYILLGLLSDGPRHGYDLFKKITSFEGIAIIWKVKQPQLYALLDKLEAQGLLTSKMIPGEAHQARKEFHITHLGQQAFQAWVTSPVLHGRDMRQEFPAKIFFAQKSSPNACLELIEKQKSACRHRLDYLKIRYENMPHEHRFERMVFQFRILQTQAALEWLALCQAEIQAA